MNQVKNTDLFYSVIKEVFELIELVKCPICLEICSEPTIFNCKHTFCLKCIENTFKETPLGKRTSCPVCRKVLNKRQKYRNDQAEQLITYINGISCNLQNICEFNIFADNSFINFIKRYSPASDTNNISRPSTSKNVTAKSNKNPGKTNLSKLKSKSSCETSELDAFDKLFATSNNVPAKSLKTYKNKKKEEMKENEPEEFFDTVVEFENTQCKEDIIKWLTDSKNEFDRLTQTTQGSIDEYCPDEDLLSISQNTNRARHGQKANNNKKKRRCRSLGIHANTRAKTSLKRKTLGVLSNEHKNIQISDSESDDKQLTNLVNLVEDDFIKSLDVFHQPKTVKKNKQKVLAGETSGWSRMHKMNKKGKKTNTAQKLNICLESHKKNVSEGGFEDVTLVNITENEKSKSENNKIIVMEDEDGDENKINDTIKENVSIRNKKGARGKKNNIVTTNVEDVEVVEDSQEETSVDEVDATVIQDINKRTPYVQLTDMENFFQKHISNLVIENLTQSEYSVADTQNNIIESSIPAEPTVITRITHVQSEPPQKENVHNVYNMTKEVEFVTEANKSNQQNSSTDSLFDKPTQQICFDDFQFEKLLYEYIEQHNTIKESLGKFNIHGEKSEKLSELIRFVEPILDKFKPEIDKIGKILNGEKIVDEGNVEDSIEKQNDSKCEDVCKEYIEKAIQTDEFIVNEISTPNVTEKCIQTDDFICIKCKDQNPLPNSTQVFVNSAELNEIHFDTQDSVLEEAINKTIRNLETREETTCTRSVGSNKASNSSSTTDYNTKDSLSGGGNNKTIRNLKSQEKKTSSRNVDSKKTGSISGTQSENSRNKTEIKSSQNANAIRNVITQNGTINCTSEQENIKSNEMMKSQETITQIMEKLDVNTQKSNNADIGQGDSEDIVPNSEDFIPRRSLTLTIEKLSRNNSGNVSNTSRYSSGNAIRTLKSLGSTTKYDEDKEIICEAQSKSANIIKKSMNQLPVNIKNVAGSSKEIPLYFKELRQFKENVLPEINDKSLNRLSSNSSKQSDISISNSKNTNIKSSITPNILKDKEDPQIQTSRDNSIYLGSPNTSKNLYNIDLSSINHKDDPILEEIFKENVRASPDSDLLISIETPVKKQLHYPDINGENKYKRIRQLSSDSESDGDNLKKKAKYNFIRNDVSIHFDSETQKSLDDEVMKVTSLGSSDINMDYVDRVWDKIDKGLLGVDLETSSPPKKKIRSVTPKKSKTQDILEKCDQIINDVTIKIINKGVKDNQEKEDIVESLQKTLEDENWQDCFIPDETNSEHKKTIIDNKVSVNYMTEDFLNENNVEEEMEMFEQNTPKNNTDNLVNVSNKSKIKENANKKVINVLQNLTMNEKDFDDSLTIMPETNNIDVLQDFDVNKAIEEINTQTLLLEQNSVPKIIENSDQEIFQSDSEQDVIESTPPEIMKRSSQCSNLLDDHMCAIPPPLEFQDLECSNKSLVQENSQIIQSNILLTSKISDSEPFLNTISPISKVTKPKVINIGLPSTSFLRKHTSTPKVPKQSSMRRFVKKSQEKPEEIFKLKFKKTKPCIACTRLTKEQVIAISSLTHKQLATYSTVFNDSITHMIVSTTENNCVKDHTIKFVSAVAAGIWVLSFNWVQECIAKKTIVPEEPYEVLDVSGVPGPRESRLNRSKLPLFKGFKIHAAPPFISTTQSDVENVVNLLGGKVASDIDDLLLDPLENIRLIIAETRSTQDFEIYEGWLESLKIVTVDIEWLSRSVGQYKIMGLRRFALCSDENLGEIGYPQELLEPVPCSFSQSAFN